MNITQATKDLYIHRNTLLYRMNKIKKIGGVYNE
ncbi:helix-turn-helix domain-containing protein [Halanaerobium congolense]